eukprot:scaffold38566_cov19-Tisochrysis_lutea.AAC.1
MKSATPNAGVTKLGSWAEMMHLGDMHQRKKCCRQGVCSEEAMGRGDVLAQGAMKYPPPKFYRPESANGDLEGYWEHPPPG